MKRIILFFLFLFVVHSSAQTLFVNFYGTTLNENKTIDSIGYNQKHLNAKSIIDEGNLFIDKLHKIGFLDSEIVDNKKTNDSTFLRQFRLGKRIQKIHIYIGRNSPLKSMSLFDQKTDTVKISFVEVESFLNETLNKLEKKGFALAKIKLINIKHNEKIIEADLETIIENERNVNNIVINGYTKFPEGHKQNIKRLYKNKTFNKANLQKIYSDFEKFRFVKQIKYPEILFTKDSTKIYVYLEKAKSNSFDGFIGFSNNDFGKIIFNGYLDLTLNNILNSGETFSIYWKSDGESQKTFNANIELPYIFKSPFGIKAQLNIFKQDSTFQNTKTALDFGYFFNYNSRLYLGYQSTESSDIQNLNTVLINDYKNSFVTTNFEFVNFEQENVLFPEKTKVNIKLGFGSRNSIRNTNDQVFFGIDFKHALFLNKKNSFHIKSQNYYLKSETYIINELYRFGGINSIRGFNENSLQANLYSSILTEYRYIMAPSLYVHTIIDYAYYEDQTTRFKGNLLGLGFGFGMLTKNGLFNIIYANGSEKGQTIKLSNSIVHISFKTNF